MTIISHHLLRRRARANAHHLNEQATTSHTYTVMKAERGPWRWYVTREANSTRADR